jgi:hypothetical protein
VSGTDVNGSPLAILGTVDANGSGGITGGTLDFNDPDGDISTQIVANSPIGSNSSYKVGVDGRGQATLNTSTPFGAILLDFVLTSSSHGLVTEFDGNATGSGTIDLQSSGTTPNGTYAYSFAGLNVSSAFVAVGNFTIGSGGAVTGLEDVTAGTFSYPGQPLAAGSQVIQGPSSAPSTFLITESFALTFDVFAIDASHLKFIEMDTEGTLLGDAFSQTSTTIPTGPLAFTLTGYFPSETSFAAGGYMVTDGAGNITTASTEDINQNGTTSSASVPFSGTYTAAGSGRYTLSLPADSGFFGGSLYAAYPSSGGLLLLEIDDAGITAGAAYQQTTTSFGATSQGFGLNLTGTNLGEATDEFEEVDDISEFTASAAASGSGTLTAGIIDENWDPDGAPIYDLALSQGTYGIVDATGRYELSAAAGSGSNTTLNGGVTLLFYAVDGTTFPFIELDGGQVSTGVMVQQSSPSGSSAAAKSGNMFIVRPLARPRAAWKKKK